MGKKREIVMLATGFVLGIALAPAAAHAASELLTAAPSTQTFYVNGELVELEAYGIHGNNFVMLRDIGQAVGFNVYYVQTESQILVGGLISGAAAHGGEPVGPPGTTD